ncbi:MAG: HAMP domain-containing protein, partial [Actinobacteria bacterium]|nr:HAMP domain-containing protein [Actinomycetota bacterium]
TTQPRTYRLANSIRLPFWMGGTILLLVSLLTGGLLGRVDKEELVVPQVLLDFQEAVTRDAAQSVRRGLNEGIDDLQQFAEVRARSTTGDEGLEASLTALAGIHGRYSSIYVLEPAGKIVSSIGGAPELRSLNDIDIFSQAGMSDARKVNDAPLIQQYAPLPVGPPRAVVGHYDYAFLRFALAPVAPGSAWIVNREGRIVAALGGFSPFEQLPSESLRNAAKAATSGGSDRRAERSGGGIGSATIVAFAPVSGPGHAGQLGWGVVTSRQIDTLALPQVELRRQALVVATVLGVLVLAIFGWMWIVVVSPVLRLQKEAERLAHGDLSTSVEIIRYDEIGLIARALERIRVLLIRRRVQGDGSQSKPPRDI